MNFGLMTEIICKFTNFGRILFEVLIDEFRRRIYEKKISTKSDGILTEKMEKHLNWW